MPSEMHKKQWDFTAQLAELVRHAYVRGYRLTMAEGYVADTMEAVNVVQGFPQARSPHRHDGGHFKRLAQDFNLFVPKGGQFEKPADEWEYLWIEGQHLAWDSLGQYWRGLHPDNRWGGDWGDFGHFSRLDGGVA